MIWKHYGMANQTVIHGTALAIFGYGVVITGSSGSGKSELALRLIDRGHKFIADDHVLIKEDPDTILRLQRQTPQFIHIGGIGFVDVIETYGKATISDIELSCNLFIKLENSPLDRTNRTDELSTYINILEHEVPLTTIYIAQNRPIELLVEILVKKQQQLDHGYNANETFINNLSKLALV